LVTQQRGIDWIAWCNNFAALQHCNIADFGATQKLFQPQFCYIGMVSESLFNLMFLDFQIDIICSFLSINEILDIASVSREFACAVRTSSSIWRSVWNNGEFPQHLLAYEYSGSREGSFVRNLVRDLYSRLKIWYKLNRSLTNSAPGYLRGNQCSLRDSMDKEMLNMSSAFQHSGTCLRIRPHMHLGFPALANLENGFTLMCSVLFKEDDVGSLDFPNYLFCNWRYGKRHFLTSVIQQTGKMELVLRVNDLANSETSLFSSHSRQVDIPLNEWVDIAFTYSVRKQEIRMFVNGESVCQVVISNYSLTEQLWKLDDRFLFGRKMDTGNGFSGCVRDLIIMEGQLWHS
jgi:hypothetical protein